MQRTAPKPGKFGALLSVAYTSRKLQDDGSSTVRWQPNPGMETLDPLYPDLDTSKPTLTQIRAAFVPRIPRFDKCEHDQERLGEAANRLSYYHHQGTQYYLGARFKY